MAKGVFLITGIGFRIVISGSQETIPRAFRLQAVREQEVKVLMKMEEITKSKLRSETE